MQRTVTNMSRLLEIALRNTIPSPKAQEDLLAELEQTVEKLRQLVERLGTEVRGLEDVIQERPRWVGCLVCGNLIEQPWNCHVECSSRAAEQGFMLQGAKLPTG